MFGSPVLRPLSVTMKPRLSTSTRSLSRPGILAFGRRPIDLYRRIYAGINGTPMPEHFGMTITENRKARTMNEDDIWDLVFFVRDLATQAPMVAHGGGAAKEGH